MIATTFCSICGAANESINTHCFACGQLLAVSLDATGQLAQQNGVLLHNRYQIVALQGEGGFSAVFRARDMREGGRIVAIKRITLQGLSTREIIEATDTFNREVDMLSTLAHAQVPSIYDHFSDQDHWYLVLEYIEGQTLEAYLAEREAQGLPLKLEEVLALASQLCPVLEYLHSRNPPIIYRDLKPGNIMRTPEGSLCLIDFGIARYFRPGQARDTQRLGSPGYAAPEQYGQAQTTPQADIYSLGALVHFLLLGQDPPDRSSGLPALHLNGRIHNAELEALIAHMLSPNPIERPTGVRIVAEALKRIKQQQIAPNVTGSDGLSPPVSHVFSTSHAQQQIQLHMAPPQNLPTRATSVKSSGLLILRYMFMGLGLCITVAGLAFILFSVRLGLDALPSLVLSTVIMGLGLALVNIGLGPTKTRLVLKSSGQRVRRYILVGLGLCITVAGLAFALFSVRLGLDALPSLVLSTVIMGLGLALVNIGLGPAKIQPGRRKRRH